MTNSCEKYDVEGNLWRSVQGMHKKRYAASACVFRGEKIFIFGGRYECENHNMMVSEIEYYNVETNLWTEF